METGNTIGQVISAEGELHLITASGERVLLSIGDVISLNDTIVSLEASSLSLHLSTAELSGFVSLGPCQTVRVDAALLENNAYFLAQSSMDAPLTIGTPVHPQVMQDFISTIPSDADVIFASPLTNNSDADNAFVWRDSVNQPTTAHKETITFLLADITGMEHANRFVPEFTQSTGALKLGDFITGSVNSALEAANYLHATTTQEGVSGLYIDREGNITERAREALNESSEYRFSSTSLENAADHIQALMDTGLVEL